MGTNSDYGYQRGAYSFRHIEVVASKIVSASMGTNKTDCYSAASRFRRAVSTITLSGGDTKAELETTMPAGKRKPGNRRRAGQRLPRSQKFATFSPPSAMGRLRRPASVVAAATGCPTCTCYSVFDVAYDENPAARRRRRQWTAAWCRALATWPAVWFSRKTRRRLPPRPA